jgi:hypothetical protein
MEPYNIASLYRNSRHDSLNRKLANAFAMWDAAGNALRASANTPVRSAEPPSNWTCHNLARVKKYGGSSTKRLLVAFAVYASAPPLSGAPAHHHCVINDLAVTARCLK